MHGVQVSEGLADLLVRLQMRWNLKTVAQPMASRSSHSDTEVLPQVQEVIRTIA